MKFKKVSISNVKKIRAKVSDKPLFSLTEDESDVIINRPIKGKWEGYYFSQLRDDHEGRRLLFWITKADFEDSIKDVAEEILKSI